MRTEPHIATQDAPREPMPALDDAVLEDVSRIWGFDALRPLQSEAGADNRRFVARSRAWWTDAKFGAFSFWRHA